jgi:hypothetical protein
MSIIPKKLAKLSPNSTANFFLCDDVNCTKAFSKCTTELTNEEKEYEWEVGLRCTKCKTVWWICRSCKIRKKFTTRKNLSRHQYSRHTKHEISPSKRKRDDGDDNPFRNRTDKNLADNTDTTNVLNFNQGKR